LEYNPKDNKRNIYSIWYNKNENNEFIGFTNGVLEKNQIQDSQYTYDEDTYQYEYETTM
jgi:hypothetical protein